MTRVTLTVAGVAIIAAACGNSAPTRSDFNAQANSICQTYNSKLRSVGSTLALSSSKSASQIETVLSGALSPAEQGSAKLESLAQPDGEGASLEKAFRAQDAQLIDLENLLTALKQGTGSKVLAAETTFEESEAPLNQQFDELGLTACGSVSPSAISR
jgi:hypothetical protein